MAAEGRCCNRFQGWGFICIVTQGRPARRRKRANPGLHSETPLGFSEEISRAIFAGKLTNGDGAFPGALYEVAPLALGRGATGMSDDEFRISNDGKLSARGAEGVEAE